MALPLIGALIGPVASVINNVIDRAVPDKDQAAKLKAEALQQLHTQGLAELESATKIIVAEAQNDSWLTRSWRPITMLFFLALVGSYWVGLAPEYVTKNPDLVTQLFEMIQIGVGGYVVSRGAEKVMREYKENN